MTHVRRLSTLAAGIVLVGLSACTADAVKPSSFSATGYALEGSATPADITRDGSYLRTIGIEGVSLTLADGADTFSVTPVSDDAQALRRSAQKHDREAVLLVTNYNETIGGFDEDLAHQVLTSDEQRAAVVASLVDAARGFDGVQIDLESLAERDRDGLTAFTGELRRALPDTSLSMAFMASTDFGGYRERGYDLAALEPHLDRMVVMAYAQHGPWSDPGPMGSLPWVRRELSYFAEVLPNAKIDLGVAAYGYQWKGSPDTLTVAQARSTAGARARWSPRHAEWHADLTGGRTIWWSDRRSVAAREKLARSFKIHGVAIWQIGSSGRLR